VFPHEDICKAVENADALIVCTHASDETRHLIGAKEFAAMKHGAFFVNIARGSIVEEIMLIDAIRSGHLGGAGLDVQETEPLPEDSPLWDLPNVIISPHSAGSGPGTYLERRDLFSENLKRLQNGDALKFQYR
jgi:phosphoglycerate dehydrogenase-like enzyme